MNLLVYTPQITIGHEYIRGLSVKMVKVLIIDDQRRDKSDKLKLNVNYEIVKTLLNSSPQISPITFRAIAQAAQYVKEKRIL